MEDAGTLTRNLRLRTDISYPTAPCVFSTPD